MASEPPTVLVSKAGGRFVKVAHHPLHPGKPTRIAVQSDDAPAPVNVGYAPVPGGRGTLFAVNKNQPGDALLSALSERPVVAVVDRGRAVVTLPGVSWRP